jgi:hypothetical protein
VIEKKSVARYWILVGFALVAVGAIVNLIYLLSHGYLDHGNVRAVLQVFSIPLGSFAALWAWWLLSKIATLESNHSQLFRGAFIGLMLQSALLCITYVNLLWLAPGLSQFTSSWWIQLFGWAGAAVGFFLMSREFSGQKLVDRTL